MNKKDFKRYMEQGLGRCSIVLKSSKNINKYKDVVLWGCLHNLSYDPQSEGTRANYIYHLTTFFNDENYFVIPCVEAYKKLARKSDWLFAHFSKLLSNFALNGNKDAKNALKERYNQLLSKLLSKRRLRGYDFERDYFERLCVIFYEDGGVDSLLKIADDIGKLFNENSYYTGADFDWLYTILNQEIGNEYLFEILKKVKKTENASAFYKNYLSVIEHVKNIINTPKKIINAEDIYKEVVSTGKLSLASRVRFSRGSSSEEKIKLAQKIVEEPDLDKKAEMLAIFVYKDECFPLSHEVIIDYSKSSNIKLSQVAFEVLTNCRSEIVREYALDLLSKGENNLVTIKMLLSNFTLDDKERLLAMLFKIRVDYNDDSDWHAIGLKIIDVSQKGIELPKEFLMFVYEKTLCSCCRENAVKQLRKHNYLTEDIIEECRYDSNEDISKYINHYYRLKR